MDQSSLGGLPFCSSATAVPTMVQTTSPETELEALVALYHATGGPKLGRQRQLAERRAN